MCDTITAVGSATIEGAVLFGKNSDREYDEAQHLALIPAALHRNGDHVRLTHTEIAQAPETHAVLLSKPHWIWGAEIGANSHGLVIGNEAIFSKIEASMTEGIIGMDLLRLALERARDIDEAIFVITTLLRKYGQGGNCGFRRAMTYHNSFILADSNGAKVLETVDREWVVARVNDYYAISNAMTVDAFEESSPTLEARALEAGLYIDGIPLKFNAIYEDESKAASGHYRRGRAMDLLSVRHGNLEAADFFRILRDHQEGKALPDRSSGPRICAHTRDNPLGQTTASWVATLKPGQCVHWVTGTATPCTGLFKPVVIEIGLPEHGPLPGREEDLATLWWRHERMSAHLDQADQEVQANYRGERNALEAQFLNHVSECPSVLDEGGLRETRRRVADCWNEALAFESKWYELLCVAQRPVTMTGRERVEL